MVEVVRVTNAPRAQLDKPVACADCGATPAGLVGVKTARGDRLPLCPGCATDLKTRLVEELYLVEHWR